MNKVRGIKMKEAGFIPSNKSGKGFTPFRINFGTGFTLIELAVTMAVLAIIMGAVVNSGIGRKTQFNLSVNQEKLRALVSRSKGLALNSLISQGSNICGYGVHITYNRAVIFNDVSASGCAASDHKYTGGSEELSGSVNEIKLDQGIYFSDLTSGGLPNANPTIFGGLGSVDILFAPPDPTTYINGASGANVKTTIGIASSPQFFRQMMVEGSGLISVNAF